MEGMAMVQVTIELVVLNRVSGFQTPVTVTVQAPTEAVPVGNRIVDWLELNLPGRVRDGLFEYMRARKFKGLPAGDAPVPAKQAATAEGAAVGTSKAHHKGPRKPEAKTSPAQAAAAG